MVCKKKLYAFRPDAEFAETYRTRRCDRPEPCDPISLERGVRQLLADKVSGNLVGLRRCTSGKLLPGERPGGAKGDFLASPFALGEFSQALRRARVTVQ